MPNGRVWFWLAVLLSVVVLFSPGEAVPAAPPGSDKVVHVVVFGLLAVTGLITGFRRWPLALSLLGYAALSEVIQAIPALGRGASVGDWIADAVGVALGFWLTAASRIFARR